MGTPNGLRPARLKVGIISAGRVGTALGVALERAEPPSDPSLAAMHSRCAACRDEMDREEFSQWADMYASWAHGAGIQVCRRCSLKEPRHAECCWHACSCTEGAHPRRPAA